MPTAGSRCGASAEFGVWWCSPPEGVAGPPWLTIVFLHGIGEAGDGSAESLEKIAYGAGLPREVAQRDDGTLNDPELFPFLVVAPQSVSAWRDETERASVVGLTRRLREAGLVHGRALLTGFSFGGDAVWRVASRRDADFAAIVSVASEDPPDPAPIARGLATVPVWIGLRTDDQYASRSRAPLRLIQELRSLGNHDVEVRGYEDPLPEDWGGTSHSYAAREAFTDAELYEWLRRHGDPNRGEPTLTGF